MDLSGKVALVTGGTRGIGAATALALAKAGSDVALVGRHIDAEAKATQTSVAQLSRRCALIAADCSKPEDALRSVEETVRQLGRLDILVHSAGGPVNGGLFEIAPEDWHSAFDIHVHAIFYLCRATVPHMRKSREASIVLISSTAGIRAVHTNIAYQVVKGALPHFARALARELANDNIRVNCVAPGVIRTRFHDSMTPEQKKHNLDNRIPLHREGTPDQVGELILELVKNDYVTGQTVTIDGGLTMRIP